ncbi:GILT-like protein 1 [Diabrotica virgifera virgifera]|uniref:GILT-like protein 1 n=1 Tax=Diabrotica virgifera virgifera TaxID=50390 RepID=A0ABM5IN99_DIAVI|nr:GILT-like protein 1 [Diabrotica virgifera virgifera]
MFLNLQLFVTVVLVFFVQCWANSNVKITVYYEPLGEDSVKFITNQLYPAYKQIGDHLNVDLIPKVNKTAFGRKLGKSQYTYPYETKESYLAAIHACVLNMYSPEQRTEFVSCSANTNEPSSNDNLKKCAKQADLNWEDITKCTKSAQPDKLLNSYYRQSVMENISKYPTILINDEYDRMLEQKALFNFKAVMCQLMDDLPEGCRVEERDL